MNEERYKDLPKGYRILKNGRNEYWLQRWIPPYKIFFGLYNQKGKWADIKIYWPGGDDELRATSDTTKLFDSPDEAVRWLKRQFQKQKEEKEQIKLRKQIEVVVEK